MATRIRLTRVGRKKQPEYRIVVAESTRARDGSVIATLGHYRPRATPAVVKVDIGEARAWIAKGATPSETVRSLLKRAGVFSPDPVAELAPPADPVAELVPPAEPMAPVAPPTEPETPVAPPAEG